MPQLTLLGLKTSARHWISLLWTFMPKAVYLVKITPREERLNTLLPDTIIPTIRDQTMETTENAKSKS